MFGKSYVFISKDKTVIQSKIKESFSSVFPITVIVLLLCVFVAPIDSGIFLCFVIGAVLSIVGMGLFSLGADTAMTPIGNYVGTEVVKTKRFWIILPVYFVVGLIITVAEPDLQILAGQLSESVDKWLLLAVVGVGVGFFLVVAFLRMVLKIKLKYLLVFFYTVIFVLSFILKSQGLNGFIPLSFDSGGVTTGPVSVPFIIAIGTGVVALRSDKNAEDDGFGLTALCSIGPIISVMILGLIFRPEIKTTQEVFPSVATSREVFNLFGKAFPVYLHEVGIAILPIVTVFVCVRSFGSKPGKSTVIKIVVGVVYSYLGLVLFLIGINCGFLPVGKILGEKIGELTYSWIIVPIGVVIGFFVVSAEPAVHVLTNQVFEITAGGIPKKALRISLMWGVALAVGLSMLRILLSVDILWFLIPCYFTALVLAFFVPDIFTAIAFDSGGVASGAMTSSFVLPLALGFCSAVSGDIATEGFGVVAFVAMTPLITIQILGLIFTVKKKKLLSLHAKLSETEGKDKDVEILD